MEELKYCNACEHCHRVKVESELYQDRCNFVCKFYAQSQLVEMVTQKGTLVKKPSWCPLDSQYKKVSQEPKKKTAYEIKEALKNVKSITTWDDIKVNQIYHLPPLVEGDKRKDILEDIAVLTGGSVITSELGLDLKEVTIETGLVVKVPLFIDQGEKIVVTTFDGKYSCKG